MPQSEYWPFTRTKATDDEDCNGESSVLQRQLGDMEGEVKVMQLELAAIRKDRLDLYNKQQCKRNEPPDLSINTSFEDTPYEKPAFPEFPEISKLRAELIVAKNAADQERFQKEKYEKKLKDLELKLNKFCGTGLVVESKEPQKPLEEVSTLKSQVRNLKEELEEMKTSVQEKDEQLQNYRMKYLQAQQFAEELKRELEVIEFDNKQVSDQIQIEIQKMKMQFQEKLQELAPLPDLLKGAQIQLQEAKQLQKLAEESSQQLSAELNRVKEKLVDVVNSLNQEKAERKRLSDDNKHLNITLEERETEIALLTKQMDEYKCKIVQLEEKLKIEEQRHNEKVTQFARLQQELEELREESTRSLGRTKERSDAMRRYMQTQISEMERQLVHSRAQCRACQKERDDIRQRMQIQMNNLQENFEMVELRLRTLQGQVASLKSSYSCILAEEDDNEFKIATT